MTEITMKCRLEYLKGIYEAVQKTDISFPDFMECLFSKLEIELRSGVSNINLYYDNAEHKKLPINHKEYKYTYER